MIRVDPAHLPTDPPLPAASADAPAAAARALIEQQVAMLSRLAEMGMAIAEAATQAATRTPAEPHADDAAAPFRGDPVLAYTRAARAVRLTIALQTQLLKDLAALEAGEATAKAQRAEARRARLRGLSTRALEAEGLDGAALGRLSHQVWERLREAEDDAEVLGLPFAEAVAAICADLDLAPEWTARIMAAADPSSSGLSRGSIHPPQDGRHMASRSLDPRDRPEDDGGGADDTFLEWPPPSPSP